MTIYFIECEPRRAIKIGYTSGDPGHRLSSLKTGCPYKLSLIHAVDGTKDDERYFHDLFDPHRMEGEWFEYAPVRMWIDARMEQAEMRAIVKSFGERLERLY